MSNRLHCRSILAEYADCRVWWLGRGRTDGRLEDLRRRPHARLPRLVGRRGAWPRLRARADRDRRGWRAQAGIFGAQSQWPAAADRRRRFCADGVACNHALSRQEICAWRAISRAAALSENPYLLGPDFTIADLNVAAVISRAIDMDLSTWPNLENWLLRCLERPAARRALALKTRSDAETPVETTRRIARINRL